MQAKSRRGARCDQNPRCIGEGNGFAGPLRVLANSLTPRLVADDSSYVSGVGLAVDGAKAAAVYNADRYRADSRLIG